MVLPTFGIDTYSFVRSGAMAGGNLLTPLLLYVVNRDF